MGAKSVVAITKGKLDLGPWEQIFYGEIRMAVAASACWSKSIGE